MPECQSGHPKAAKELGRGLSPVVSPLTSIDVLSDGQLLGLAYHGRGISVAAAAATRSLGPPQQGAVSESSKTRSRSQDRTRTLTTMRRRWYDTAVCIKSPYVLVRPLSLFSAYYTPKYRYSRANNNHTDVTY